MTTIPLFPLSWEYDETTERIRVTLVDLALPDDPDAINHVPTISCVVELLPQVLERTPIEGASPNG